MPTVDYRGPLPELMRLLFLIVPRIASGDQQDTDGLGRSLQLRCGVTLLSKIQQDFIRKSRGGIGEDGIRWPPLARSTIANRRTTAAEKQAAGVSGRRTRGTLTAAQDRRWRQIYGTRLARLRLTMGEGEARARAAAIAWAVLKSEGAKTKLELFGGRQVDMLRDTSRLFRSLSPGVDDRPSGADGQVFQLAGRGNVIVGTNVVYAAAHQNGIPGRLPARPIWPPSGELPPAWSQAVAEAAIVGLIRAILILVQRGAAGGGGVSPGGSGRP